MLTGYQKFIWVSVLGALALLVKIIISVPFAAWRVPGVMIAAVIASIIIYAVYFIPLRSVLSVTRVPTAIKWRDAFGFAIPTLLTQLGITSLYSADIILVRHFFDAKSAGLYAALAILGKIIFYASGAVPVVLFPIASERTALGSKTKKLVLSAIGAVLAISAGITMLYFLFPDFIVNLLFGNAYQGAVTMLGQFGIFLGLFSVANIITYASLAVGKTRIWLVAAVAALIQIAGITMFHDTISGVISINIAVCLLYVIFAGGYYLVNIHEKV
jgi:O-antigen/teichoic acid export membrane protein